MANGRDRLEKLASGFMHARILITACELDLFTAIGKNALTAAEVARATGTRPAPLARLMNALVAMKILAKSGERYRNTPEARRHLTDDAPEPLADIMRHRGGMWESWNRLTSVVRTGRVRLRERTADDRRHFIKGMTNVAMLSAVETAAALAPELRKSRRALDVGGGPGTYAYAFANRFPKLRVTITDLPDALEIAREEPALKKLRKRVRFLPGDVFELPSLGRGYDMAFMSNFLHCFAPEDAAEALAKAAAAVRSGGWVVIKEFCLERGGTAPAFAALFSINMLVHDAGDSYPAAEYKKWMSDAGVKLLRRVKVAKNSTLLVGEKS